MSISSIILRKAMTDLHYDKWGPWTPFFLIIIYVYIGLIVVQIPIIVYFLSF